MCSCCKTEDCIYYYLQLQTTKEPQRGREARRGEERTIAKEEGELNLSFEGFGGEIARSAALCILYPCHTLIDSVSTGRLTEHIEEKFLYASGGHTAIGGRCKTIGNIKASFSRCEEPYSKAGLRRAEVQRAGCAVLSRSSLRASDRPINNRWWRCGAVVFVDVIVTRWMYPSEE